MKAILEFNLPEEQEDFEVHTNAWKYKIALDEISNKLRSLDKYGEKRQYGIEDIREIILKVVSEELE